MYVIFLKDFLLGIERTRYLFFGAHVKIVAVINVANYILSYEQISKYRSVSQRTSNYYRWVVSILYS